KRLKEKIKNYTLGLEEILKIQPVTFQYNSLSENDTEKKQVGIIAQEIEKIIPQTVSLLDDSKGPTGIKDLRLFNASELIYTLINSVKSLNSKIERLETQNQQLQKKLQQFILNSQ
ncbi:MAG: tail fiber domain-containing protein, partial [Flavobacteriaceae bacterium]